MSLRYHLIALFTILIPVSVTADVLKPLKPSLEDYASLLKVAGYELFAFDIAPLTDEAYNIEVIIREYSGDTIVSENLNNAYPAVFHNRVMIEQFDEEARKDVTPEKMYNAAKGIYSAAEKINIGFLPKADSRNGGKEVCTMVELPGIGSRYFYLNLQPQSNPWSAEPIYSYNTRPFETTTDWKDNEFIPLVLLGSVWFDNDFKVFRFCGENEISPDMSSDILKYLPHYYVIGVTITKQSK